MFHCLGYRLGGFWMIFDSDCTRDLVRYASDTAVEIVIDIGLKKNKSRYVGAGSTKTGG